MSYGQLIWDVPKIDIVDENKDISQKSKAVEVFLNSYLGDKKYEKHSARVIWEGCTFWIYGYDVQDDSADQDPFFNFSETIKNEVGQVYFLIACTNEKWKGQNPTRKIDGKYYYFYKLVSVVKNTGTKVTWKELAKDGVCELIAKNKRKENTFTGR